jgi:hypothetical protein
MKYSKTVAAVVICSWLTGVAAAQSRLGGSELGRTGIAKPSPSFFSSDTSPNSAPYHPPAAPQARPGTPQKLAPLAVRAPQPTQPTLEHMQAAVQPATSAPRPPAPVSEPVAQAPVMPAASLPLADAAGLFAVDYHGGQLSIVAEKAELGKIVNMIGAKTGASVEVAPEVAAEPVVARLGPGSPRQVLSQLLDSPHLTYIVMGSDEDGAGLQRILVRKRNTFGRQSGAAMRVPVPQPMEQISQQAEAVAPVPEQGQPAVAEQQPADPPQQ